MPTKLSTTVLKIHTIPNAANTAIIEEFHKYMKDNDASERHQNNALKVVIAYAKFLGSDNTDNTLYDIKHKEQITSFLDSKIKPIEQDPDRKWITTWNHYLHRIKHLLFSPTIGKERCKLFHSLLLLFIHLFFIAIEND